MHKIQNSPYLALITLIVFGGLLYVAISGALVSTQSAAVYTSTNQTIKVGDRVKTIQTAYLHDKVTSAKVSGTQFVDAVGTVVGAPVLVNGYYFVNVNFDKDPDGWVAVKALTILDTTGPTLKILSPLNGITVSGTIDFEVSAEDQSGVAFVQLWYIDKAKNTKINIGPPITKAPYRRFIGLAPGTYSFGADAQDILGNKSTDPNDVTVIGYEKVCIGGSDTSCTGGIWNLRITFAGTPGHRYEVQKKDLSNVTGSWQVVSNQYASTAGTLTYQEPLVGNYIFRTADFSTPVSLVCQATDPWATIGHDSARTGASGGCISGNLQQQWMYAATPPMGSTLNELPGHAIAQADGIFYRYIVNNGSNAAGAIDRIAMNGSPVWKHQGLGFNHDEDHWLTIMGNSILFNDDFIQKIDKTTGYLTGTYSFDTWGNTLVDPSGSRAYTVNDYHLDGPGVWVGAISSVDASFIWKLNENGSIRGMRDFSRGALALDQGTLFYAPQYHYNGPDPASYPHLSGIYAFDSTNGAVRWMKPMRPQTPISAGNDRVYVVENSTLKAYMQTDGSVSWTQPLTGLIPSGQHPVIAGTLIIFPTGTGIYAFNASTGAPVWATPMTGVPITPFGNFLDPDPIVTNATVIAAAMGSNTLVATADDGIHILSLANGAEMWRGKPASITKRAAGPVIVGNRLIVVDTANDLSSPKQVVVLKDPSYSSPIDTTPPPSTYAVTLQKYGAGTGRIVSSPAGIDCGTNCSPISGNFSAGSTVTLTVTPDGGSVFTGWGGVCSGTGSCVVSMNSDKYATAYFDTNSQYVSLNVTKNGTGTGRVTSTPSGLNCGVTCSWSFPSGTSVTLTATPDTGSTFTSWSGACSGSNPTCTLTITKNTSARATFSR